MQETMRIGVELGGGKGEVPLAEILRGGGKLPTLKILPSRIKSEKLKKYARVGKNRCRPK